MTRPSAIQIPAAASGPRRRLFNRAPGAGLHRALAADATVLLTLFGEIGWEVTPDGVHEALTAAAGADVTVKINSPGGIYTDGVAVYNLLRAHPGNVRIEIIGIAASAASLIAMAGDTIAIAKNAHLMQHKVWSLVIGDAQVHEEEAGILRQLDKSLAQTYADRTGIALGTINAKLAEGEWWMDGQAAVDIGFADELLEKPADAKAMAFDLSIYQNAPAALRATSTEIGSRENLETMLRTILPRGAAKKVARAGWAELNRSDDTADAARAIRNLTDSLKSWREKL